MRINLIGGAYSARSIIANAQRSINYFPEFNRRDSPNPFTLYQRAGRRKLTSPPTPGQGRGLYQASNGNGYAVVGQKLYSISAGFVWTLLGALDTPSFSQVSFIDNGTTMMVVDGSPFGYQVTLATNAFSKISDATGSFTGATQLAILDTFILYNYPGTRRYGSTLSGTISFDALYVASKSAYPDPIKGIWVNRRELILFGALKSEIWYNVGATQFPFAILPGAYIEHGLQAPFSIAANDLEVYWLAQDLEGDCMVLKLKGYDVSRVSNHAIENAFQQMKLAGADLSQAIGMTYQIGGHAFYELTFPSGNQTWVFDASLADDPTMAWHQQCWNEPDVGLVRMRDGAMAFIYGRNLSLDHTNGDLYMLDQNLYLDQVNGVDCPIMCIRSFPHIIQAWNSSVGQSTDLDGKMVQLSNFRIDFEAGASETPDDVVSLRWSWDRGKTFGNTVSQSAGEPGAYITQPKWSQLGAQGRDCVIEVEHQINGPAALQGAWVDAVMLEK